MSDEQWDDVINTNFARAFLFCRAAQSPDDASPLWTDH
jgi:NAD(P)-dependent dehydrogenase (short-subunit alcohol dehydrogenase family)